jgi:hypothetical protein
VQDTTIREEEVAATLVQGGTPQGADFTAGVMQGADQHQGELLAARADIETDQMVGGVGTLIARSRTRSRSRLVSLEDISGGSVAPGEEAAATGDEQLAEDPRVVKSWKLRAVLEPATSSLLQAARKSGGGSPKMSRLKSRKNLNNLSESSSGLVSSSGLKGLRMAARSRTKLTQPGSPAPVPVAAEVEQMESTEEVVMKNFATPAVNGEVAFSRQLDAGSGAQDRRPPLFSESSAVLASCQVAETSEAAELTEFRPQAITATRNRSRSRSRLTQVVSTISDEGQQADQENCRPEEIPMASLPRSRQQSSDRLTVVETAEETVMRCDAGGSPLLKTPPQSRSQSLCRVLEVQCSSSVADTATTSLPGDLKYRYCLLET